MSRDWASNSTETIPKSAQTPPRDGRRRGDDLSGQVLEGRFRVERQIGRGGMGAVYKGWDEQRQCPVAIKILPDGATADAELARRFEREARMVEGIHHPNIAQVYATGRAGDIPYYVMEFIDGPSLADVLAERGRIGGRWCLDYLRQSALGLREAASRMITHRDIKPANLMLNQDGVVKIVDFGIAKADLGDSFKTATGQVMGTAMYMSPEQARGAEVDLRSDIYSLGATFYHIVTGRPPFEGDSALTVMMKHVKEPVRSILEANPNVPENLCQIIYTMMAKNPAERFQDYDQLLAALDKVFSRDARIQARTPVVEGGGAADRATEEPEPRRRFRLAYALAAMAVVLVIAAWVFRPQTEADRERERRRAAEEQRHLEAVHLKEQAREDMLKAVKQLDAVVSDRIENVE